MTEKKYRILLVDDEGDLLSLWKLRLESNGYEVTTALSGEEALAKMSVINPNVVLTDLRMPGIDGVAFCYLDDGDVVRHRLVREIIRAYAEDQGA